MNQDSPVATTADPILPRETTEESFRLLVESVKDYAIFMLDPAGYIMSWNVGARRIKGYEAAEIVGRHFSCFYLPEAVERRWPQRELDLALELGRFEDEGRRVRKDGSTFWANVIITPMYDRSGRLYGFAKVTRDLSERQQVESLRHGERQMTRFVAMLAHELRNPLAPIQNAVSVMRAKLPSDQTLQWGIDIIERQAEHLARLVDDLLEVSRITTGKVKLKMEAVDVAAVAARVAEACRPQIEARGHRFTVVLPEAPLTVRGDETRLAQTVFNLLNNAAKFTPTGGDIRLLLESTPDVAMVRVSDTGIGIPPAQQEAIFDVFVQAEGQPQRTENGLGIGLTLVRDLIAMHGGSVEVYSEGLGKGSEFIVRLPLAAADSGAPASREEPAAAPLQRIRSILVVDDNVDAADSMAMLLRLWGYEVRTAHDGPEAVALATSQRPDVVLLDIGLPRMSGYEVAGHLRSLGDMEGVAFIAVTGYGQPEHRERARAVGFNHHLLKPVESEALRDLLAELDSLRD